MKTLRAIGPLGFAVLIVGCAATSAPQVPSIQAKPPTGAPNVTQGYLAKEARPNSLLLVPPPPAPGSEAMARDEAAAKAAVALRGGPRWNVATNDAELKLPQAAQTFSCALGVKLDPAKAPHVFTLLQRSLGDLGLSTYAAKTKYMRARPFTANGAPTCTPSFEPVLRKDGSYPSGHSAAGFGWGMILAELAPDRGDQLVARGRAFGQSRVICNVHWQSDVEEGRVVAAAVVARLHSDPQFRADLEAARAEMATLRQQGTPPDGDCAAEAAALAAG
ncbi:phosphatase PAP2 family protein [Phenylobacterium sp. LjRoot219]|uniref:acid phosphatase n=1 Tax=Phenylobacterium sp. LjRoot219 TaxID=3342283 RepID=UPI003ED02EBF